MNSIGALGQYISMRITVGAIAIVVAIVLYMDYLIIAGFGIAAIYFGGTWAINHPGLVVQYGSWAVAILAVFGSLLYAIGEIAVRFFDLDPENYTDDADWKDAK